MECLQPPSSIHELKILFYKGRVLPSWISNPTFDVLENVILHKCRNFYGLPSLGELSSLKCLSIVENNEVVEIHNSFCRKDQYPKLEKLSFRSREMDRRGKGWLPLSSPSVALELSFALGATLLSRALGFARIMDDQRMSQIERSILNDNHEFSSPNLLIAVVRSLS